MVSAMAVKRIRFRRRTLGGRFFSWERMRDMGQANNWQNFQSKMTEERPQPSS
jgi:hypothetical protein